MENAVVQAEDWSLIPDYKTQLRAWDRIAEVHWIIKKKWLDWKTWVNLAILLNNK